MIGRQRAARAIMTLEADEQAVPLDFWSTVVAILEDAIRGERVRLES